MKEDMWLLDFLPLAGWSVGPVYAQPDAVPASERSSGVRLAPGDLLRRPFVGIWSPFSTVSVNTVVSVPLPNRLPFSPQGEARDQTFLRYRPLGRGKGRGRLGSQNDVCV